MSDGNCDGYCVMCGNWNETVLMI